MFLVNSSLRHLTKLHLCLTEYSAFTYRSVQAATRYAYDLASLLTSVSSLRLQVGYHLLIVNN